MTSVSTYYAMSLLRLGPNILYIFGMSLIVNLILELVYDVH